MCWAAKTDEMVTDGNPVVIGHPRERERERAETRVKNQKCLGYVESEEQIGVTTVPLARTSGTSTRVPLSAVRPTATTRARETNAHHRFRARSASRNFSLA